MFGDFDEDEEPDFEPERTMPKRQQRRSLNRRARCTICGRFYSEPTPDDRACDGCIYDYNVRVRAAQDGTGRGR